MSQIIRDSNHVDIRFKDFIVRIAQLKSHIFTGNLIVKVGNLPSWSLSFLAGRLVDISGGIDASNRWQRSLAVACLNLPLDRFVKSSKNDEMFLNSNVLAQQYAVEEILFDIIQFSQQKRDRLSYQIVPLSSNDISIDTRVPSLDIEPILAGAIQAWQQWASVGLAAYSPSFLPVVPKSSEVSWSIDSEEVAKAILSFDGRRSVRSLAIYHHQNLLDFTKPLLPLLLMGGITLLLPREAKLARSTTTNLSSEISNFDSLNSQDRPLIACIDDSIAIYKSLEKILDERGYRSFGIQDPLKILTTLIKNKPDFIFLDLLMPITNGYEVCKQIRKTPSLKNIPIAILTGKDGSIDRIHAKFVGANEFISKPVQAESIMKMLDKHLLKSSFN